MATHKSALSLYNAQKARFRNVRNTIEEVNRVMAEDSRSDLQELTAGGISSAELVRRGHPYGRGPGSRRNLVNGGNVGRRGNAPLRPVNKQSGRLRSSIALAKSALSTYDLSIATPYAKYIMHPSGTKFMVGRGVMGWREVNKSFPMGELERRHRIRVRAYRDAVRRVQNRP